MIVSDLAETMVVWCLLCLERERERDDLDMVIFPWATFLLADNLRFKMLSFNVFSLTEKPLTFNFNQVNERI